MIRKSYTSSSFSERRESLVIRGHRNTPLEALGRIAGLACSNPAPHETMEILDQR